MKIADIDIKDSFTVNEAGKKTGVLAKDLGFNSYETAQLSAAATATLRGLQADEKPAIFGLGIKKVNNRYGAVFSFPGKIPDESCSAFDLINKHKSGEGCRTEAVKLIKSEGFIPGREFLRRERERVTRKTEAQLNRELKYKTADLERLLDELKTKSEKLVCLQKLL